MSMTIEQIEQAISNYYAGGELPNSINTDAAAIIAEGQKAWEAIVDDPEGATMADVAEADAIITQVAQEVFDIVNRETFEVWLVPNGRLSEFSRGMTGNGYPDACKCWGIYDSREEAAARIRELAEEESLTETRTDEFCADLDTDMDEEKFDDLVEKNREAFVAKCVENMGFEWRCDLDWVRAIHREGNEIEVL